MLKQKTVYFREEDLPLWEAVENKAEWLHAHLKWDGVYGETSNIVNPSKVSKADLFVEDSMKAVRESRKRCKIHDIPLDNRDKCLQKGCKYA